MSSDRAEERPQDVVTSEVPQGISNLDFKIKRVLARGRTGQSTLLRAPIVYCSDSKQLYTKEGHSARRDIFTISSNCHSERKRLSMWRGPHVLQGPAAEWEQENKGEKRELPHQVITSLHGPLLWE